MPFGFHLTMDTLPSAVLTSFCGQRVVTPAFGYGTPHLGARGTSTLLKNALLSAHYVTIAELSKMGDKEYQSQLRAEGFIRPGPIEHDSPHVIFVLNRFESHSPKAASGRLLTVTYKDSESPPNTIKDGSQALAAGSYGRDGVFHATVLRAKCASKYCAIPAKRRFHQNGIRRQPARQPS